MFLNLDPLSLSSEKLNAINRWPKILHFPKTYYTFAYNTIEKNWKKKILSKRQVWKVFFHFPKSFTIFIAFIRHLSNYFTLHLSELAIPIIFIAKDLFAYLPKKKLCMPEIRSNCEMNSLCISSVFFTLIRHHFSAKLNIIK